MTWRGKVVETLGTGLVSNERVMELARKVKRLDQDVHGIDLRLIRIETSAKVANQREQLPPEN
ncbi:MAG TPA: hypothetical protein VKB96_05860 [Gammaproteobacteria bacterium]|jgi:hypothetical protein|nr:hypothetical protein [Gammaproteobacteria bacterium]